MLKIILVTGQTLLIDDEDIDLIRNYRWRVRDKKTNHVRRVTSIRGKSKTIYLHRAIMEKHGKNLTNKFIDHIDRNPLNCQKDNMRVATASNNSCNISVRADNTTGIKGVNKTREGYYQARIGINGKRIYLGTYKTIELATESYNKAAEEYHKDFAFIN